MAYELDFIGVNKKTDDATAISIRWKNPDGSYTVGVFDGGTAAYGDVLKDHMIQYYFDGQEGGYIDFVICSHPHNDHATGLKTILENFDVGTLYMNCPWDYADELYECINDHRMTPKSLAEHLREIYDKTADLEEIAQARGIKICSVFEGAVIADKLTVLSPSREFYLDMIAESEKTTMLESASEQENAGLLHCVAEAAKRVLNWIAETWNADSLHENVKTQPDNETSTVILGEMEDETFLLTGDVGIKGLERAMDYADSIGKGIQENVTLYEIPHHGGRHNVSPSIMNRMVGEIVEQGVETGKQAIVCTGKDSDHPKRMVVNAFLRRGVTSYNASGYTIHHHCGSMPSRGWGSSTPLEFYDEVEEW